MSSKPDPHSYAILAAIVCVSAPKIHDIEKVHNKQTINQHEYPALNYTEHVTINRKKL